MGIDVGTDTNVDTDFNMEMYIDKDMGIDTLMDIDTHRLRICRAVWIKIWIWMNIHL